MLSVCWPRCRRGRTATLAWAIMMLNMVLAAEEETNEVLRQERRYEHEGDEGSNSVVHIYDVYDDYEEQEGGNGDGAGDDTRTRPPPPR